MADAKPCPYIAGQTVVYRPSDRGRGLVVMTELANLVPGRPYRVAHVVQGQYVVVEGFEEASGGGLYWTEFAVS